MLLQWSANSTKINGHFLSSDIAEWQFQKKKSPQILSDVQLLRHFASTFLVTTDFAVTCIILIIIVFAKIRLIYDIFMFFCCL